MPSTICIAVAALNALSVLAVLSTTEGRKCRNNDVFPKGKKDFSLATIPKDCTEVAIAQAFLGDEGGLALAKELASSPAALVKLGLFNNKMSDRSVVAIAEAIKNSKTITGVWLKRNNVRDAGISALAEVLKVNTAIDSLVIDFGGVSSGPIVALAEALKVNTALRSLWLTPLGGDSDDYIDDVGAAALADALKVNTALTAFGTREDNIENVDHMKAINASLASNREAYAAAQTKAAASEEDGNLFTDNEEGADEPNADAKKMTKEELRKSRLKMAREAIAARAAAAGKKNTATDDEIDKAAKQSGGNGKIPSKKGSRAGSLDQKLEANRRRDQQTRASIARTKANQRAAAEAAKAAQETESGPADDVLIAVREATKETDARTDDVPERTEL